MGIAVYGTPTGAAATQEAAMAALEQIAVGAAQVSHSRSMRRNVIGTRSEQCLTELARI